LDKPFSGFAAVSFLNRSSFCWALLLGFSCLRGCIRYGVANVIHLGIQSIIMKVPNVRQAADG
jgi:hypothetical protein